MSISHVFTPLIKKSSCQRPQKGQQELSKSRDLLRRSITSGVATDLFCSLAVVGWSMLWSQTAPVRATGSGKFHGKIQRSKLVRNGARWMSSRCPSVESVSSTWSIAGRVLGNSRSCFSNLAVQWSPIASRRGKNVGRLVDAGFLFLDPLLNHGPHLVESSRPRLGSAARVFVYAKPSHHDKVLGVRLSRE